ncbi:MAG: YceI family protein, partial [Acidimicrobiales bacterium]
AVYRALAQLERDGLVAAAAEAPAARSSRRMYRVTPTGERVLREWMSVVKEEHDHLSQVLRRYQATGTTDAMLAEVEGGWSGALGLAWSAVSSTSNRHRPLVPVGPSGSRSRSMPTHDDDRATQRVTPRRFHLLPDRSVILVEARSTVGPLSFGTVGLSGTIDAVLKGGRVVADGQTAAHLEIDVTGLRSGNALYDAELLRRIDARRFPLATVDLAQCAPTGPGGRYRLSGELTFHGVTRATEGTVSIDATSDSTLVITGDQVFDIRDFAIPSPTLLMLRIYPDVHVRLHAEAELEER